MSLYKVAWKASTKEVRVIPDATSLPASFIKAGDSFNHDDSSDKLGLQAADNHVLYQHVQDQLYKVGHYDMQNITIKIPVASVDIPATLALAVGADKTLYPTISPANATDKVVTWSSATPAKATVNATTGVVHGVAAGTSVITATTHDGSKTDTCTVTVS